VNAAGGIGNRTGLTDPEPTSAAGGRVYR